MIYTLKIQKAIRFAIKTHEVYQKQKRKGKDIPYIIHPLSVGLILARAGASEDVIIAGILHDTVEDSVKEKKPFIPERIEERFGKDVLNLVLSVTEKNKDLPWEERKAIAIKHIESFNEGSIMIKSADIISNFTEIYYDFKNDGDKIFDRFNAGKEKVLENYKNVIKALIIKWDKNPFLEDLKDLLDLSFEVNNL